jgi:hypothetical protein
MVIGLLFVAYMPAFQLSTTNELPITKDIAPGRLSPRKPLCKGLGGFELPSEPFFKIWLPKGPMLDRYTTGLYALSFQSVFKFNERKIEKYINKL